jgi:hypothetical protein
MDNFILILEKVFLLVLEGENAKTVSSHMSDALLKFPIVTRDF